MTITESICSGGVIAVPDMRGGEECYSDSVPFENLIITQTPPPGELVSEGQTVINVVTEDGQGNATICTHYLNVSANNPAPTLECPDPITTWLLPGGYAVPDFTTVVKVRGGCTVYDDLVITQDPEAGTLLTTAGTHTITISVEDEFGHTVVCGTTSITLNDTHTMSGGGGSTVTPPDPPVMPPSYIYSTNLLAYWPLDDLGFLLDRGTYILGSGTSHDLTNAGGASQVPLETVLDSSCHPTSPGPIFGRGSLYSNASNAYLYRSDEVSLRLTGTSFTMRFGLRLKRLDVGTLWHPLRKSSDFTMPGYQFRIARNIPGTLYSMDFHLHDGITLVTSAAWTIPLDAWFVATMTWDNTAKQLKYYLDGSLQQTVSAPGFNLTGDTADFKLGDTGSNAEVYMDEVGIWSEAWTATRVLDDYHIITCMT